MSDDTTDAEGDLPSGRFVLRIDPELHAALRRSAREAGLSLNELCARTLAGSRVAVSGPGWRAVERAVEVLDASLVGVVAYGSWARDELAAASDVDVLVVVDDEVAVTRELYRRWDRAPVLWESRRVEPHFVHLPGVGESPSGTWAEAAVDGVVLFDRDLAVSRRLADLRRTILAGRVVRREAHGQPYWVGVG